MASRLIYLALVVMLFHTAAASRKILQTCPPAFDQYICAASYIYPCNISSTTCPWYSFSNGADFVIINPASGPGTAVNSDYANLISSIRAKQPSGTYISSILGYVPTTYGAKSLAAAKAEIDKYNNFYKVDGIFFDEASTSCTNTTYYGSLVQYVRSNTKSPTGQDFTTLNWGVNGPECFLKASPSADNFVGFEGNYSTYQSYAPSTYMSKYSPDRWYNIIYGVIQANLIATLTKSKSNRAGLVYVTNDTGSNPYDTAPSPYTSYWKAEVNKVAQSC